MIQIIKKGLSPAALLSRGGLKLVLAASLGLAADLAVAAPANDDFASAEAIAGVSGSVSGSNVGATLEGSEPNFINTDDFAGVDKSVWYAWTAPTNGVVSFDTFGSGFDSVLAVYTNTADIGNLVAGNNDYIPNIIVQSHVTFMATAGTTYYISVNGNAYPTLGGNDGNLILNWSQTVPSIPSGTFQFTSDNYVVSDGDQSITDSSVRWSTQGARVTVTRVNGHSGRVYVPYTVTGGSGQSAANSSGELIFDDYQMSADIFIPVSDVPAAEFGTIAVALGTPRLDSLESPDLIAPEVSPTLGTSQVTVNSTTYKNAVVPIYCNFERATYRVKESSNTITIRVNISQAPSTNETFSISYTIDHLINPSGNEEVEGNFNNQFQLQAGSDYATPDADFTSVHGTLVWGQFQQDTKEITIQINQDEVPEFNEDFEVELYNPIWHVGSDDVLVSHGMVDKATVTILDDDQPAGALDKNWNVENSDQSIPPFLTYPGTQGGVVDGANGNGGTVYAAVTQPDGKTILGGSFTVYDSNPYNRIVRTLANGYPDPTFLVAPNSGANGTIRAIALQDDGKIVIGGDFTSFNGSSRYHVARLNADGTLDASFNPGSGANGNVWAVKIQSGQILIGGEFTTYNGKNVSYFAQLNTDGSLDASFDTGTQIDGPVYAIGIPVAPPQTNSINVNRTASGGAPEDVYTVDLGPFTSGILNMTYDFLAVPDDMKVFYGDTNTIVGTGILIWDSGLTNNLTGPTTVAIPFGPTNGFVTNKITIVMNQGNGDPGTAWDYDASISTFGVSNVVGKIYVGGAFAKVGGQEYGGLARFNLNGTVDSSFNVGLGTYNPNSKTVDPIYALGVDTNGFVYAGGTFAYVQMEPFNGLARFETDGHVDLTFGTRGTNNGTFNPYTRQADRVNAINLEGGDIFVGGDFVSINQTRRVGVARLFTDGSVDTRFMDTAYNQFAGLVNHYYNPDAINLADYPMGNQRNAVHAISVEPDTQNVIIGGKFLVVGGGYFEHSTWKTTVGSNILDNARMDVHPRSNVARLIGGGTNGPGNIEFSYPNYSASKADGHLYVTLERINGNLGIIGATFASALGEAGQAGVARIPEDFTLGNLTPIWPSWWFNNINTPGALGWMYGDGKDGMNKFINSGNAGPGVDLLITNNGAITGDLNAGLALAQPFDADFDLGGEKIPLGAALGARQSAAMKIIDPNYVTGTFGFSASAYTSSSNSVTITITRINGSRGVAQVGYSTFNGTAVAPGDYTTTFGTKTFLDGETSKTFTVPIVPRTSLQPDKSINLQLYGITGGGKPGQTNAVLTIVNNVFGAGHIAFAFATNGVDENAGSATIVLNRLGGTSQALKVTAITSDGTAVNGVNYVGSTKDIQWISGDATPKTITIPVKHDGINTPNLTVNIRLTNGIVGTTPNANVLGLSTITNTTLVITNVDFTGVAQFTVGKYSVKKFAGYALIPVIRTGGSAGQLTVNYSTSDATAHAGVDYSTASGSLTFSNGVVSQYFQVPINAGSTSGLVALNLTLTGAVGSPSAAVLNIIDTDTVNEQPGAEDVTFDEFAGCNGSVFALALQTNQQLIVGGDFTQANKVPRNCIARLNADGSLDTSFSSPAAGMGANDQVRAVAVQTDGRIVIGGFFTNVNSVVVNRIARLNYDGTLDSLFNPGSGADSPVYAVAEAFVAGQRKVVVGGAFNHLDGVGANGIGRLNDDGTPDVTFNPGGLGANATVYAVAVQPDGKVLMGGDFTSVNGVSVGHIARLNTDGSVDRSFTNAVADASVRAITLQADNRILIGGYFTNVNGAVRNHIARLNADGTVDASFTPGEGADGPVLAIAFQSDSRILVGGTFTHCSGVTRNRITRLLPDGTVDPTINFGSGANEMVAAIVVQKSAIVGYPADVPDEKIILGGGFTEYNGRSAPHLVRIFGGSQSGPGAFEFTSAEYTVNENGTHATITVSRTGGTDGTNYVNLATSDDTAQAGVNYTAIATNLMFVPGEVEQTVEIPVQVDGVITEDLTVDLTLTPTPPADYGDQPIAVLTIVNTDSAISFASETYLATKYAAGFPDGYASIEVNRLGSTVGTSSVMFNTTTNGTALPGVDYQERTNVLVTFAPGVSSQTVQVPVINGTPDGDRTVTLQLSDATGSALLPPTNAVLTILDRTLARGEIMLSATNYVASEGAGTISINVIRTNGYAGSVTVDYTTVSGTALPGVNYTTKSGTLTFNAGETNQVISVPLINNNFVQGTTEFSVQLSNVTGGATLSTPDNATVSILDNDSGIAFASATNSAPETGAYATVSVLRFYNTNSVASVHYQTMDGTAVAGVNYLSASGDVNFAVGQTIKSVSIPLIDSTNATGDLTFTVSLTSPVGAQLIAPSNTVVVIKDMDAGITFTNSTLEVLKSAGIAEITVICSNPDVEPVVLTTNDIPLKVDYYTVDGSAKAGVNYWPASGTLYFTNGIATNTFTVPIYNNFALTGDKTFDVVLTNVTEPGRLMPYSKQTVVIKESNAGFRFSAASYKAAENTAKATITVYRTGYTNTTASVNFMAANGTAVSGANFISTNGTLLFTNGVTSGTFDVVLIDNSLVQPNLSVLLQLLNPTNGVLDSPSQATLTIVENDGSYVVPAGSQMVTNYTTHLADGIINSNNTVQVLFALRAESGLDVTNLIAYLQATNGVASPSPASQVYGPLKVGGHAAFQPFSFTAVGTNAQPLLPTFALYDGAKYIGTAQFAFAIGTWTSVFSNTTPIVIRDKTNAVPYPSTISVSGIGSTLVKATVTLTNLTHAWPADIAALVVSPSQTNSLLMGNAGAGFSINKVTLTFDDAATNSLPQNSIITNGVYRPTIYEYIQDFP